MAWEAETTGRAQRVGAVYLRLRRPSSPIRDALSLSDLERRILVD